MESYQLFHRKRFLEFEVAVSVIVWVCIFAGSILNSFTVTEGHGEITHFTTQLKPSSDVCSKTMRRLCLQPFQSTCLQATNVESSVRRST